MNKIPDHLLHSLVSGFKEEKSISDAYFDKIYPPLPNRASYTHWTPIEVIKKIVSLISPNSKARILDIGSGSGKFCLVGALLRPDLHFTGVELRTELTDISEDLADQFELTNTRFINSNAMEINWKGYDILYFFNPFWEDHLPNELKIDSKVPIRKEEFDSFVKEVSQRLEKLRKGTQVITYHGFGGKFPPSYDCLKFESCGTDQVELWQKVR